METKVKSTNKLEKKGFLSIFNCKKVVNKTQIIVYVLLAITFIRNNHVKIIFIFYLFVIISKS